MSRAMTKTPTYAMDEVRKFNIKFHVGKFCVRTLRKSHACRWWEWKKMIMNTYSWNNNKQLIWTIGLTGAGHGDTHASTHINRVRSTKCTQFVQHCDGVDKCCCFSSLLFRFCFFFRSQYSTRWKQEKRLLRCSLSTRKQQVYTPVSCIATLC